MNKFACGLKSSHSYSLSLWQCLVVYLLEFRIIFVNKTMKKFYKFTIPSLVCIK